MPKDRIKEQVTLGIVGDSAAGKTTLSRGIAQILGVDRVVEICSDDYHRYSRAERSAIGVSALDVEANYIDIMEQHFTLLCSGNAILKPIYNHDGGTLDRPKYIAPQPYVVIEGLLGYTTRRMRQCYDVKVFLAPDEDLRVRWKIQRDTLKRGYSRDEVLASLEKRKEDSPRFISPQRTYADMVVTFFPPPGQADESGGGLHVRIYLRPTLPHPDIGAIAGCDEGLTLELIRGPDGKPVDMLTIGDITDARARKVEDWLWDQIPEASHLRENVGQFTDQKNQRAYSHPLALTQLLITYHMVKAALGVHAV
jgi:phosphoribulokinase